MTQDEIKAAPLIEIIEERIRKLTEKAHKKVDRRADSVNWIHGDNSLSDYCSKCVDKAVKKLKKQFPDKEIFRDGGWNEYHESDTTKFCELCGRCLFVSLSVYGCMEEANHWQECEELSDIDKFVIYELFNGVGSLKSVENYEFIALDLLIKLETEPLR